MNTSGSGRLMTSLYGDETSSASTCMDLLVHKIRCLKIRRTAEPLGCKSHPACSPLSVDRLDLEARLASFEHITVRIAVTCSPSTVVGLDSRTEKAQGHAWVCGRGPVRDNPNASNVTLSLIHI